MWTFILIFSCCVAAQVASQESKAECEEFEGHGFPPISADAPPSSLADLKVALVVVEGRNMLNISWAINIDSSIGQLMGTRIMISGEPEYRCRYNPPLVHIDHSQLEQKWFYYLVKARHGFCDIQAANLPLPPLGSGNSYRDATIDIPRIKASVPLVTPESDEFTESDVTPEPSPAGLETKDVVVSVFGVVAGLVILSSCYLIYKSYGSTVASSLGFHSLPDAVPVLLVYPAEDRAFQQGFQQGFQRAVVALAEFLQRDGGCSVALELWQQGKVAELGPIRWLDQQMKTVDRVLLVCPGGETKVQDPPLHGFPQTSIPAAAADLYPLVLNTVAAHAKDPKHLEKFWVVHLDQRLDRRTSSLPPELKTCRSFHLMKDLKKLCRSLHAARRTDRKLTDLLLTSGFRYNQKNAEKLKEAVEMLTKNQRSDKETQQLRSVISRDR